MGSAITSTTVSPTTTKGDIEVNTGGNFVRLGVSGNNGYALLEDSTEPEGVAWKDIKTKTINTQTGTTYTLALTDADSIVEMNNAAANTVTIPANATTAFPVGTILTLVQYGAGVTTVQGAVGVTVNGVSAGSKATAAQYEGLALYKRATDEWIVVNK